MIDYSKDIPNSAKNGLKNRSPELRRMKNNMQKNKTIISHLHEAQQGKQAEQPAPQLNNVDYQLPHAELQVPRAEFQIPNAQREVANVARIQHSKLIKQLNSRTIGNRKENDNNVINSMMAGLITNKNNDNNRAQESTSVMNSITQSEAILRHQRKLLLKSSRLTTSAKEQSTNRTTYKHLLIQRQQTEEFQAKLLKRQNRLLKQIAIQAVEITSCENLYDEYEQQPNSISAYSRQNRAASLHEMASRIGIGSAEIASGTVPSKFKDHIHELKKERAKNNRVLQNVTRSYNGQRSKLSNIKNSLHAYGNNLSVPFDVDKLAMNRPYSHLHTMQKASRYDPDTEQQLYADKKVRFGDKDHQANANQAATVNREANRQLRDKTQREAALNAERKVLAEQLNDNSHQATAQKSMADSPQLELTPEEYKERWDKENSPLTDASNGQVYLEAATRLGKSTLKLSKVMMLAGLSTATALHAITVDTTQSIIKGSSNVFDKAIAGGISPQALQHTELDI